ALVLRARHLGGNIGLVAGHTFAFAGLLGLASVRRRQAGDLLRSLGDALLLFVGASLSFAAAGALVGLMPPIAAVATAGLAWYAGSRRAPRPLSDTEHRARIQGIAVALAALAIIIAAGVWLTLSIFDVGPG